MRAVVLASVVHLVIFVCNASTVEKGRIVSRRTELMETLSMQRDSILKSSAEAARETSARILRCNSRLVSMLAMSLMGLSHRQVAWQTCGFASRLLPQGHMHLKRCSSPQCVRDDAGALAQPYRARLGRGFRLGTIEKEDLQEVCGVNALCLKKSQFLADSGEDGILDKAGRLVDRKQDSEFIAALKADLGARLIKGGTQYSKEKNALVLAVYDEYRSRIVGIVSISILPQDWLRGAWIEYGATGYVVPGDYQLVNGVRKTLPWVETVPDCAYLNYVCVLPSLQGRGVGKALLRIAETVAKEWGFSELYLHPDPKSKWLVDMYARYGYECLSEFNKPNSWFDNLLDRPELLIYQRRKL